MTIRHSGKPKCVNGCPGRVNFTCCGHAPAMEYPSVWIGALEE